MRLSDKHDIEDVMNMVRDIAAEPEKTVSVPLLREACEWLIDRTEASHDWADTLSALRLAMNDLTPLETVRRDVLQMHSEWMDWKVKQTRRGGS